MSQISRKINTLWKSLSYQLFKKKSNLADFSSYKTVIRLLTVGYTIFVLYSLSTVQPGESFSKVLYENFMVFTPYLLMESLVLLLSSALLKKVSQWFAIFYMFFTTFLSTYLVYCAVNKSFTLSVLTIEPFLMTVLKSLSMAFFFIIYFDWKHRSQSPLDDISKILFLQSKMDPHFLFNCLNTISYLVKKEPVIAQKMISNLADLIRVSLQRSDMFQTNSLESELELVSKYLDLEKIRMGDKLIFDIQVEQECLPHQLPQLILQPIVENCINHSQEEDGKKSIKIKIYHNIQGYLIIESSNKVSVDPKEIKLHKGNGISIQNITQRLELYYQGLASIETKQKRDKFFVRISVPEKVAVKM